MHLLDDTHAGAASLATLLSSAPKDSDHELAARYAPSITFDSREPFMPLAVGYTIFREDGPSPSFPRTIELSPPHQPAAAFAIEYAIWWDWDIGHLYELEHVWVYAGEDGGVCRVEASWHGGYTSMAKDEHIALAGDHPLVYSEPGKHAFAATPAAYHERRQRYQGRETQQWAGSGGLWVTPLFASELSTLRTPATNTLVRSYLQRFRFQPAWDFKRLFPIEPAMLVPWPALRDWIPRRIVWIISTLEAEIPPQERRYLKIGHRGASAHAPDNTLAAFRKAAELNVDMVELDVQLSADGVPVVIHDLDLGGYPGQNGAVRRHTWAQLAAVDAGSGEHIPTLDEAIAQCRALGIGMYIEIKDGSAIPAVVQAIQEQDLYLAVIVGSFRPDWLAWVKAADSRITTSVLFGAPQVDPVALAQAVGASFVHPCWEHVTPHPHQLLTPDWLQRVRDAKLGIITWHEERPEEIAALRRLGVDGICSNTPELL